jgi:hypothetical protein
MGSAGKLAGGKSVFRFVRFETLIMFLGTQVDGAVQACEFPVLSLCRNHAKPRNNKQLSSNWQKFLKFFLHLPQSAGAGTLTAAIAV